MTIKAMGISLLIAESNLISAAAIADRLYVIDRGEIIFHGTPQGGACRTRTSCGRCVDDKRMIECFSGLGRVQ